MKNAFIIVAAILFAMLAACKKDDNAKSGEVSIKFMHSNTDAELHADTVSVASDLTFECKALVSPTENIETIYYRIWLDYTMAAEYSYAPERGKDLGYLLDPIAYTFDYSNLAGIINIVRLQVEAVDFDGTKHAAQLAFKVQPVKNQFQSRKKAD